jgi:L-alanine-DL-glutamate epimerase-like enolase superfamily enzyme
MRLTEPYAIAYETIDHATNVFLRIVTDGAIVGLGCAAPDEHLTGETVESVLGGIREIAEPVLLGADASRWAAPLRCLSRELSNRPAVRAAVDLALFDILGKSAEIPLWKLLGGCRDCIPTSVTVGILSDRDTVARARQWVNEGFRVLKIKGGRDVESDIARVQMVRAAIGGEIELRFDANQGYTVEQALHFISQTQSARLQLLEQPTPRGQLQSLAQVTRQSTIPIMADESMMNVRDAFEIARHGLANMVNVKLMKIGGIAEAMEVDAVAGVAGVQCMVGSVDESALGIAAGLAFALSRRNVVFADLDGHLGLENDPAGGAVMLRDGSLFPSEEPGLGLEVID